MPMGQIIGSGAIVSVNYASSAATKSLGAADFLFSI